jgi:hypothetical protein
MCFAYNAFMCFAWISEQTAIISLYSINLSVFITEAESVYCAVRTGSLNQKDTVSSLKGHTAIWGEKQRILGTLSGVLQVKKVNQSISNIRHRAYMKKNV